MRKLLLLSLVLAFVLGCGTKKAPYIELHHPDDAEHPVIAEYEIPIDHDDLPNAPKTWKRANPLLEVVVPPSKTPTVVHIKQKKKSVGRRIAEKVLPPVKPVDFDVASTSKGVEAKQEKRIPWFNWIIILLIIIAILLYVANKIYNFAPWSLAKGLITRYFKK